MIQGLQNTDTLFHSTTLTKCFNGWVWLNSSLSGGFKIREAKVIQVIANASSLEVDPSRIVVGGSSAGANIVGHSP
jgi:predicted esterase